MTFVLRRRTKRCLQRTLHARQSAPGMEYRPLPPMMPISACCDGFSFKVGSKPLIIQKEMGRLETAPRGSVLARLEGQSGLLPSCRPPMGSTQPESLIAIRAGPFIEGSERHLSFFRDGRDSHPLWLLLLVDKGRDSSESFVVGDGGHFLSIGRDRDLIDALDLAVALESRFDRAVTQLFQRYGLIRIRAFHRVVFAIELSFPAYAGRGGHA